MKIMQTCIKRNYRQVILLVYGCVPEDSGDTVTVYKSVCTRRVKYSTALGRQSSESPFIQQTFFFYSKYFWSLRGRDCVNLQGHECEETLPIEFTVEYGELGAQN